ncbi:MULTISPECIES: diacylglycerol/lipid kinase family protein [Thalassobaculum]|uniref:Lipid kinase, YegS/Rv2252/BmrU family n=1 Tax=Thalassobaculum litoreum DSM 18839 TaxID=1123362 RepID=A0A8G2BI74_9PROT|nr:MULTISPECIES: diacylglycerol kinase family protein [Thalassobaculum]SDF75726.1 lipid kinase, YegS/Rv2252/BmrU family [Thalassobaculum litoreum DSM 18839]
MDKRTDSATAPAATAVTTATAEPGPSGDPAVRQVRRALIIFNRNAGGGRKVARLEETVAQLTGAGVEVEIHRTSFAGDAEQTAHAARFLGSGPDVIICAGGDGTINEVVNGLAGGDTPLALLPIGTANVLAAEIGLATDTATVVDTIFTGVPTPIHLGTANGRYFTLMTGVGLDAEVVASVDRKLKRRTGKLAYALATLKRWTAYRDHHFRVTVDGVEHRAAGVVVANGHYYGGRFVCAENARITEPGLHVCLFQKPGRWQAVYYMLALFGGFLDRLNTYRVIPGREIHIADDRDGPVQGDGDIITQLPLTIGVADETVRILMPRTPV